jgi:hypothetical protein
MLPPIGDKPDAISDSKDQKALQTHHTLKSRSIKEKIAPISLASVALQQQNWSGPINHKGEA